MSKKPAPATQTGDFFQTILTRLSSVLCILIAISFFLLTRDSAQVKITLFHIGALSLFALWLASFIYRPAAIFTKKNLMLLLPFALYGIYVVFSFFCQPYMLARGEDFLNFILSCFIFLIVAFEFRETALIKIFKAIYIACWLVFCYGLLQILNNTILPGADLFFFTDAFGARIFSTI
ncbi:MAG: hypothetical protein LBM71_05240, partial [Elusimicrobiota bacterium]|nr:hypothetical protein [Elusimicrobiota bacterium]